MVRKCRKYLDKAEDRGEISREWWEAWFWIADVGQIRRCRRFRAGSCGRGCGDANQESHVEVFASEDVVDV